MFTIKHTLWCEILHEETKDLSDTDPQTRRLHECVVEPTRTQERALKEDLMGLLEKVLVLNRRSFVITWKDLSVICGNIDYPLE